MSYYFRLIISLWPLGSLWLCVHLKKQNQSRPSVGNPKSEYLNPKQRHVVEPNLKKQSQFELMSNERKFI